ITPEPREPHALRYADGRVFADGRLIVCVRETHGAGEPTNELVVLPTDGSADSRVIATGRDFYAGPRPSPDDARLAWIAWDHPRYTFLSDGRIACFFTRAAVDSLELLDPKSGRLEPVDLPYTNYGASLGTAGTRLVLIGASPTKRPEVVEVDVQSGKQEVI